MTVPEDQNKSAKGGSGNGGVGKSRHFSLPVELLAAIILALGGIAAAKLSYDNGEYNGRQAAIAERQPTIEALRTSVALPPPTRIITVTASGNNIEELSYTIPVFASKFPIDTTHISIQKDDDVQIIVQGDDANWSCNLDEQNREELASAEGLIGVRNDRNLVRSANLCELIGYIQNSNYFRVGSYEQFIAEESGTLYLGANDWKDCDWNCYSDNKGTLSVRVVVLRKKTSN